MRDRSHRFRRSPLAGNPRRRRLLPQTFGHTAPPRSRLPRWLGGGFVALLLLTLLLLLGAGGYAYSLYQDLADSLKDRVAGLDSRTSFETTRIFDRNGALLYELYGSGKRTRVTIGQISPLLINATIAIEDKTFFANTGVDYDGILKAVVRSFSAGEVTGGASTITQQLVKRVVLTDTERDQTWQRKIKEIALAEELSQRYPKPQVLELYLNEIYYGSLAYGAEAAAQTYFGVAAKDLTLAQAALLAGLPQLPNVYDPFNYLEDNALPGVDLRDGWLATSYELPGGTPAPKRRQIAVLTQMVDEGYITEQAARAAAREDLQFAAQEAPLNAPHFVVYVRKQLEERYGQNYANRGLSVTTSIDLGLQELAQRTAADRIAELQERNIHNASVVVMQPITGQILAMVGSIDFNRVEKSRTPGVKGNVLDGQVNVAVRGRQPGSALKPFTYLTALERGLTTDSILWDVPTSFGTTADPYEPQNNSGKFNGPLRMRSALANSLNIPAVKALKFAGVGAVIDLLRRAGVQGLAEDPNYYGLALTLGGGEVTPLELTSAYNTLAGGGRYAPPVSILKVTDSSGNVLDEAPLDQSNLVLNPYHVAIITDMLSDDQARAPIWGLGSKLKLSRPAAVKTGTSNDYRDAWAAGFTPYLTIGVWTGNNNNEPTARVESLTGGGVIWHNLMEAIFADPRLMRELADPFGGALPNGFALPPQVTRRPVCQLPGAFNALGSELFTPDMSDPVLPQLTTTAVTTTTGALQPIAGCAAYSKLTLLRLGDETTLPADLLGTEPVTDTATLRPTTELKDFCRPTDLASAPAERLQEVAVWNLPPPDPDMREVFRWNGAGQSIGDLPVLLARPEQIPLCTDEQIAAVTLPPGAFRMPDLQRLGENQAKELLRALGHTGQIVVDYQGRDRIGALYDQFVPYAVISHTPPVGAAVLPGETIILGIRAPDPGPQPTTQPQSTPQPTSPANPPVIPGLPTPVTLKPSA